MRSCPCNYYGPCGPCGRISEEPCTYACPICLSPCDQVEHLGYHNMPCGHTSADEGGDDE